MNRNFAAVVAAAALTIGGVSLTWAQNQPSDNSTGVGQAVREEAGKVGIGSADKASQKMSPSAEEIHDVLAQVAEAAVTKDGLDDIVERFVDADRNRLGQNEDALKSDDVINGRIAQIQKDWKEKYNADFDIQDEDKVYNAQFAMIVEGELGNQARTASGTVGGADASATLNPDGTAKVAVDPGKTGVDAPAANTNGQTAADRNTNDAGRNVATVRIAESHGMPALVIPMIHEAGGWKIDIPDNVDAAKFKNNLQTGLTKIGDKKADWAANQDDAYRAVTHGVLLAIFDQKADGASHAAEGNAAEGKTTGTGLGTDNSTGAGTAPQR